jgi:COP9 signalosome complex subunit 7
MSDQGAKLEQFIVLAKSARGESAAKLVLNAISAVRSCSGHDTDHQPGVYVFSELLEQPSIQDVS